MVEITDHNPTIPNASPSKLRTWQWAWLLVFLGNLPVPLFLAIGAVRNGGYLGMAASLFLFWLVGYRACSQSPFFAKRIVIGGAIVGMFQVWPLPQLLAGITGLALAEADQEEYFTNTLAISEWQGFLATSITGGLLMSAAVVIGVIATGIAKLLRISEPSID